ncbi:unnamed protein product, partial [Nesidiocoris tenuis]
MAKSYSPGGFEPAPPADAIRPRRSWDQKVLELQCGGGAAEFHRGCPRMMFLNQVRLNCFRMWIFEIGRNLRKVSGAGSQMAWRRQGQVAANLSGYRLLSSSETNEFFVALHISRYHRATLWARCTLFKLTLEEHNPKNSSICNNCRKVSNFFFFFFESSNRIVSGYPRSRFASFYRSQPRFACASRRSVVASFSPLVRR